MLTTSPRWATAACGSRTPAVVTATRRSRRVQRPGPAPCRRPGRARACGAFEYAAGRLDRARAVAAGTAPCLLLPAGAAYREVHRGLAGRPLRGAVARAVSGMRVSAAAARVTIDI